MNNIKQVIVVRADRESALDEQGRLAGPSGEALLVIPVSVGNPHLVVIVDELDDAHFEELGPFLVGHPTLRHGANVQMGSTDGSSCRALIWERGAGPTSASGSSACAVAVAMVSEGRLQAGDIPVHMRGGTLQVALSEELDVVLRGPVEEICTGTVTGGLIGSLGA